MKPFQQTFTDNATQPRSTFELDYIPLPNTLMVYVEGIFQANTIYSLNGKTIEFSNAIPAGYTVTAVYQHSQALTPTIQTPTGLPTVLTENTTIVTGASADVKFLLCDINGKTAGLPLYKFSYSDPDIDLIIPHTDIVIKNGTFTTAASAYGVAVSLNVYETGDIPLSAPLRNIALPLYKTTTTDETIPAIRFNNPTIGSNLSPTGTYLVLNVNSEAWGAPIVEYSTIYPSMSAVNQQDVNVTTTFDINPVQYSASRRAGSTNFNSKLHTYSDVILRAKKKLGYPMIEIELCDEQFAEYIDEACEWYTKYAGFTEEFFAFDSTKYVPGRGLQMDEIIKTIHTSYNTKDTTIHEQFFDSDLQSYRKVINAFSLDQAEFTGTDALFTLEYIYAQQVYYSYMLGSYGFDLVTWETLKQFLDTRKRMFSSVPRYMFDPRTQRLRLVPEPTRHNRFIGILGLYVERPIVDIIKERWVNQYTLALAKIALGHIRGKYSNVNLFGGGSLNGNDLLTAGTQEKDKLEEELLKSFGEAPPPLMFVGSWLGWLVPIAAAAYSLLTQSTCLVG